MNSAIVNAKYNNNYLSVYNVYMKLCKAVKRHSELKEVQGNPLNKMSLLVSQGKHVFLITK